MLRPSSFVAALENWLALRPLRRAALWLGIAIVLVYCGMPADELTFDNAFIIGDDTRLRIFSIESLKAIFVHDYWWPSMASNLYRPLTTLSFWLEYSVLGYGKTAFGYQATNAVLHWVNCVLLFSLGRRIGLSRVAALAVGLIFAVHPIATEVVANIVGRSDLFATAAVIGGVLCYLRASEAVADDARMIRMFQMGLCGLVGVASKESAIVLVVVIAGHGLLRIAEWRRGGRERARWLGDAWRAMLCLAPCAFLFLVTRYVFSSDAGVTDHPFIDNPLILEGFAVSRLSAVGVWGMQIAALFAPLSLSNDYSFNAIPVAVWPFGNATSFWGWGSALGFCIAAIFAWRAYRKGSWVLFLLGAYVAGMLPTSNLLVRIGSIRADRFHYMPSAFFWLLAAFAVAALARRTRTFRSTSSDSGALSPIVGLVAAWIGCLLLLAHFRCYDWRSNLSLWTSSYKTHPNSAKVLSASGNVRVIAHESVENEKIAIQGHLRALALFKENQVPIRHWPLQTYSDLLACYLNIYDVMAAKGEREQAEPMLDSAFAVYAESQKVEQASRTYWNVQHGDTARTTIRMVDVLSRNYALALSRRGRHDEALKALDEVIELLPLKIQNRATYADLLQAAGKTREALAELILIRIMEPAEVGDLNRLGALAKKVDPAADPLIRDEKNELRLNLADPLIKEITRKELVRYRNILIKNELALDAARVDRVARYFYGFEDWK